MSQQSRIDSYFKSKSSASPPMANQSRKRRSLSLIKSSPKKIFKEISPEVMIIEVQPELIVITDDESENKERWECTHEQILSQGRSDGSAKNAPSNLFPTPNTSSYSAANKTVTPSSKCEGYKESINCSSVTVMKENFNSNSMNGSSIPSISTPPTLLTPKTPQKSPKSSSSNGSPSTKKFYSPTKKRSVLKKVGVKRNLASEYGQSFVQISSDLDEAYVNACQGMDDKSIFLLKIIHKCLNNEALKDLLDETSQQLLSRCLSIPKPGLRLVCRLYWHIHRWYKEQRLVEICSTKKEKVNDHQFKCIMNWLVDNDLLMSDNNSMTFDDYIDILKMDNMKNIIKTFKLKMSSKQSAIEALRNFSQQPSITKYFQTSNNVGNNSDRVLSAMRTEVGNCYKLSELACDALYKLHLLVYLGMDYTHIREKKLELLLIQDNIKDVTYPIEDSIQLDTAADVFKSRDEFLRYLKAHKFYENYLEMDKSSTSEKCAAVKQAYQLYKEIDEEHMLRYRTMSPWLRRFTPPYIYIKLLESGIQELKKLKEYNDALDILSTLILQKGFREHKKAQWYAEQGLILHKHLHEYALAAQVLLDGLSSNIPEELKDCMKVRVMKLAGQKNTGLEESVRDGLARLADGLVLENSFPAHHVDKQPTEGKQKGNKKKFVIREADAAHYVDVEEYCVWHYTRHGDFTHGEHREGRIVTTIFFLLFWDIIYKDHGVKGAFLSKYQVYPLDMFHDSFYSNRKRLIENRLQDIANMNTETLVNTMKEKWDERPIGEVSGIDRNLSWESVAGVAECAGAARAAVLCRRLAMQYAYARSGFPDLTLWNIHTKKIKFVEVKSDGDSPSLKQLQWMKYLREHDIDTGFCYVGVNTAGKQARARES